MSDDLWTRAVRRSARRPMRRNDGERERSYEPACDFTPREEDKVHDLMGRIRRGTLSRKCVDDALEDAHKALVREEEAGGADAAVLRSLVKVYEHVLQHGEFRRNGPRGNPQLQILENPADAPAPPASVRKAVEKFHGTSEGDLLLEYEVGEGAEDGTISLAYLGRCPFIAWLSKAEGAKRHSIDVEGEEVAFTGFRQKFSGKNKPMLCLRTDTNEAVIVGPGVEKLRERCSRNGALGAAPVVEYVAEDIEGTSKGDDVHYVHEFGLKKPGKRRNQGAMDPETLPRLEWDDEVNGLVYRGGAYVVTDWFHK